ncbi:MAG: hypothetical protein KGJ31_03390 [Patescibacteria group bacterium]|nr:hypothetical protein [Patescibacteria group bacterium]
MENLKPAQEKIYSTIIREHHPEKMSAIEDQVRNFWNKVKLDTDPVLDDKSIAHVANLVANRLQRKIEQGASTEELDKAIADAMYEGLDVRMNLKKEGMAE